MNVEADDVSQVYPSGASLRCFRSCSVRALVSVVPSQINLTNHLNQIQFDNVSNALTPSILMLSFMTYNENVLLIMIILDDLYEKCDLSLIN